MKPDVCIYHGPVCSDGFAAAWVIASKWPGTPLIPAQYGDEPPIVAGMHVLIVDFSYPKAVLEEMARTAKCITVLDHHKTAQADLAEFTVLQLRSAGSVDFHATHSAGKRIQAIFNMEKSGARLAWEYAWGAIQPPMIIQHVEDRDLWKFSLQDTRAVVTFLLSHPFDLDAWTRYAKALESPGDRLRMVYEGEAILRDRDRMLQDLLNLTTRTMVIGGHKVPVANMPYSMASDAAGQLAEGYPFAATYFDRADGLRAFSLRSRGGADVSAIAEEYGGGGHPGAAGFSAPAGWEGELVAVETARVTVVDEEIV